MLVYIHAYTYIFICVYITIIMVKPYFLRQLTCCFHTSTYLSIFTPKISWYLVCSSVEPRERAAWGRVHLYSLCDRQIDKWRDRWICTFLSCLYSVRSVSELQPCVKELARVHVFSNVCEFSTDECYFWSRNWFVEKKSENTLKKVNFS